MAKCELCPIQNYCIAYKEATKDNDSSYHPQILVRVSDWGEPSCPLVKLINPNEEA